MTNSERKRRVEKERLRREGVKRDYGDFFAEVSELLFRDDPIGINFGHNDNEYDAEAGSVIPRLCECHSVEHVTQVVHEEFVRWFGEPTAGGSDRYQDVSQEIWEAWERRSAE